MTYAQPAFAQEKRGVIPHAPLLKTAVPDTVNQEVAVYHAEYEPGGINPRHLHPAGDHLPHPFRHRRLAGGR